jgi:signal peptidase I
MGTWFRIVLSVAAGLGAIVLVLYLLFFDVWRVPADDPQLAASIEPTLSAGDLIVVTRRTSGGRGDLERCADPDAPGRFVVGRAIAHFGERVGLNEEVVTLDGHRTPSPRACDPPSVTIRDPHDDEDVTLFCSMEELGDRPFEALRASQHPERPTNAVVDPSRWFLVSDDRHIHQDSRDYGQIDPKTCQHIVFRLVSAAGFTDSSRRLSIIW